jgi:hypothetical protein
VLDPAISLTILMGSAIFWEVGNCGKRILDGRQLRRPSVIANSFSEIPM